MWFDPGLAGLFITLTLLHLGKDINLLVVSRMCVDYRKLNLSTRKDHFPLPFMDQMLQRLAGKSFYCFLDGYNGYN